MSQPLVEIKTFPLAIPKSFAEEIPLELKAGEIIFILGANGSGKSSLMHHFYTARPNEARRITAHRQTWFSSTDVGITSQQRQHVISTYQHADISADARWSDKYPELRLNMSLYDFIAIEHDRNQAVTAQVDSGSFEAAKDVAIQQRSPRQIINDLLKSSGMPIEIALSRENGLIASKDGGLPYSVAELSDGERNALFIAASVLTAESETLILIDEPERHLHRSIISPFLTALLSERPDCAFIISTHDVMLPSDNPSARAVLLRGCVYYTHHGVPMIAWDAQFASDLENLDEEIKKDILGARKTLLFVEGEQQSLDKPLYNLLFPDVSVIPKASCRDVERAVFGIREAEDLHWVHAFGIVDNDRRSLEDIKQLEGRKVYALPVFSVESIYYHPFLQERVANLHAETIGETPEEMIRQAKDQALIEIRRNKQHLCVRVVDKIVRRELFSKLPRRSDIGSIETLNISINVQEKIQQEDKHLEALLVAQNLTAIIEQYPIRESGAIGPISRLLGFQKVSHYKGAVLSLLKSDQEALDFVKGFLQALYGFALAAK